MLIIPMWLELTFKRRHPPISEGIKPARRYYYSPVTHGWWRIESGVAKRTCFDEMDINEPLDVAAAETRIREEDDALEGYDDRADIVYTQATMDGNRIRCDSWGCWGFAGEKCADGVVRCAQLPWHYGWYQESAFGWSHLDDERLVFYDRRPCYIRSYETIKNGFEIEGIVTNKSGDLLWHTISAERDGSNTYHFPVYVSTVTTYLLYLNSDPMGIPTHPVSYVVYHTLQGNDGGDVAWEDADPKERRRLCAELLSDPSSGLYSAEVLRF